MPRVKPHAACNHPAGRPPTILIPGDNPRSKGVSSERIMARSISSAVFRPGELHAAWVDSRIGRRFSKRLSARFGYGFFQYSEPAAAILTIIPPRRFCYHGDDLAVRQRAMIFMQAVPKRNCCLLAACVRCHFFSEAQADQVIITPVADAYTRQFCPT